MSDEPARPRYPIESVDNALRLLLMLQEGGVLRVSDAARDLEIAPSSAHRLLAMLQYHGFVEHDETTRTYLPGRALIDVGLAVVKRLEIRRRARASIEELGRETQETVHLTLLDGRDVLFVDAVESTRTLRAADRTGWRIPAHATASGKVILAELEPPQVAEVLGPGRLQALTAKTITRRDELMRELDSVREAGYAVNRGESEAELWAVAAAIPETDGPVSASIVVSAPGSRVDEVWVEETAAAVRRAAEATAGVTAA